MTFCSLKAFMPCICWRCQVAIMICVKQQLGDAIHTLISRLFPSIHGRGVEVYPLLLMDSPFTVEKC